MTGVSDAPAVHIRRSGADQALDVGRGLVDEQSDPRATTAMSDVLLPRVHPSAVQSDPAADRDRVEGMNGHAVMTVERVVPNPRAQRSEVVIVLVIDHVPATAVNGQGTIAAKAAPVPPAHRNAARIVPVVVLVLVARANDL